MASLLRFVQLMLLIIIPGSFQLLDFAFADDSFVSLSNANFSDGPTLNDTTQELRISSLPGWQIAGIVQYIQAGGNITLPDEGRGVQLGKDGQVSQAFSAEPGSTYSLTFSLASAGENCSTPDFLNVSVSSQSASFYLEEKYSESWETHAWGFNAVVNQENLTFSNQLSEEPVQQDPNITCGPVLDTVSLKKLTTPSANANGNLLINGGFEEGPYSLPESSFGVLLEDITDSRTSPVPGWAVGGTVKYVDSTHYFVPQGSAAIELVGGPGASLHQSVSSSNGASYVLNFEMGNGEDLCVGNMTVQVTAGESTSNFTFNSMGKGSYENYTMQFKAVSETTNVSITNLLRNENEKFVFCGPVIDNVIVTLSSGSSSEMLYSSILIASLPTLVLLIAL